MKAIFNIVAVVAMAVTGAFTTSAQLSSLPIGSNIAILEDTLRHIDSWHIKVKLLSNKQGVGVEALLDGEYPHPPSASLGQTDAFVRERLTTLIRSVNFDKPWYAGREFLAFYSGLRYLPDREHATSVHVLLAGHSSFTLEKNDSGELVPPVSAANVVGALMQGNEHKFFADGVVQTRLELEDGNGKVTAVLESTEEYNWVIGRIWMLVEPAYGAFWLPIKYIVGGQPGRVTLWYKDGAKRVYRLTDGTLFPQLEIAKKPEGLELTVLGTDSFVIESSPNFVTWTPTYILVPLTNSPPRRFLEKNLNGKNFYRLRVTEPAVQRR